MIIIQPQSGLANRMRALDSAIQLSSTIDTELKVSWVKTPLFNCRFDRIFRNEWNFDISEHSSFMKDNGRIEKFLLPIRRISKGLRYSKYCYNSDIYKLIKSNYDFKKLALLNSVYVQSGSSFFIDKVHYENFTPIDELMEKVSVMTRNFSNTIGIHIRRGDHFKARIQSPTHLFVDRMQQEIELNENTTFFLSTDSPEEETYLTDKFGARILKNKKDFTRSTEKGIQDAVVDLWCLSKTVKIFGSYWSSFSETAAAIGKIKLETLRIDS